MTLKIKDVGEKRMIAEFIRPFFNSSDMPGGVGDDCAMIESSDGTLWLFSTDRVPADLISFRLGIIDYEGLGKYLARLNISDITACGGQPVALLLNFGLPNSLEYEKFVALCKGAKSVAEKYNCQILGGDITSSSELSISATSIGKVLKSNVLTRRGAQEGDSIFVSRPLGLTPAAFAYYLKLNQERVKLSKEEINLLNNQFISIDPHVALSLKLSTSGYCSSCIDNTDGVGQSLLELSIMSNKRFVVAKEQVDIPLVLLKIAKNLEADPIELAFSAGADFSLIGTLKGYWSQEKALELISPDVKIIGRVETGQSVFIKNNDKMSQLQFSGWNYFL